MSFNKYRKLQDLCRLDRFQPARLSCVIAIKAASHIGTSPTLRERSRRGTNYHNRRRPLRRSYTQARAASATAGSTGT